ncbi:hypothetical protein SD70_13090 [Gordoniibacillus kamchatkensis]|uniref:DUF421 domain-containing protein n=1 Tax=Gordoniibacillus kamchatkensis TaxID=1590651 RepID=A0ABR5AHG2_9BACL|nr:DUF421 domain-containing protein [Paenibacillus sp. VKM B-2647]KIL40498.1 hypothetical protein SD70_13090 [Paenibacillus sp. VKM B-2647]
MNVSEILVRTVAAYVALFFWCRVFGKKQISQMTFFDYVAGITLGAITSAVIFTKDVPLWSGVAVLSTFALLSLLSGIIVMKSQAGKKLLAGEPSVIIRSGDIVESAMRRCRLTKDDLLKLLRGKNVFHLDEVEYAVLETDGSLSVLKKADELPVTRKDMNIRSASRGLSKIVALDGKLAAAGPLSEKTDPAWLAERLSEQGIGSIEEISLAQLDEEGTLFVDVKQDQAEERLQQ